MRQQHLFTPISMQTIKAQDGFTLTEMIITVAIIAILSAIAIPNYVRQLKSSRQNEVIAVLSQIQTTLATYIDTNGAPNSSCSGSSVPTWADLNSMAAIMTNNGPANDCTIALTTEIVLPNENYSVKRSGNSNNDYYYEFKAMNQQGDSDYNVFSCLDLSTGASDTKTEAQGGASALKCI
ncbi:prepilin-type N-terminal cleavage/methylation domain-containing protein [Synechococcus sp. MIT S9503]|uniref:prepilin-type N-terminal cleavage/methylation domain-containing protein n=1 Tax=Synechococcus sp. MIT S9503 TaxID=3082547 RepID=UPI0039A53D44